MSAGNHTSEASVRLALSSELPVISHVLTRGFARDPAMNWWGSVKDMVPDHNSMLPSAMKTMERLRHFLLCLCKITLMVGGIITVVVIPEGGTHEGEETNSRHEKILAACLWLKPGQKLDGPVWSIVRIHPWSVLFGWKWQGIKRIFFEFTPKVEHTLEVAFKSRGLRPIDSWHLLLLGVDPDHEGRGTRYCSMLMKEGFTRSSPHPVHLEATTARSRNIYEHFKFEIDEKHQFGKGQVDVNGLAAKGEKAAGYPEWVMTKWHY